MVLGTGKPAPPFPARVMPMEIGISFSCPKKKRSGSACSARSHGLGLRPTNVRLAARHSPSLSLGVHHQARFKSLDFVVLAGGIFLVVLDVLLGHNNSQWHSPQECLVFCFYLKFYSLKVVIQPLHNGRKNLAFYSCYHVNLTLNEDFAIQPMKWY